MLREPMVVVLGLRIDSRSSFSPTPSPTPLGLLLGCVDPGTPGPPERIETRLPIEFDPKISEANQTILNYSYTS